MCKSKKPKVATYDAAKEQAKLATEAQQKANAEMAMRKQSRRQSALSTGASGGDTATASAITAGKSTLGA